MKDENHEPGTGDGLPQAFLERLAAVVPAQAYAACMASFAAEKPVALRVNTLRAGIDEVRRELTSAGFELQPVAWLAEALLVPAEQRAALVAAPAVREGRVYIQNLSSMLAPLLLDPQPGEEVLDLAAAPGGKTLQMAARMGNQGRIAAVEAIRPRFFKLRALLETHAATMVDTYLADGRTIGRKTPERFDRVLLDAPCSCEARFDPRDAQSFHYWSPRKIKESSRKQKGLLKSAAECLKPGGSLLYCTCTFAPEENELVIQSLLDDLGAAVEILAVDCPVPNVQPGLTAWDGQPLAPEMARCLRILPDAQMDAAFLCKLAKRAGTGTARESHGRRPTRDRRR
jgi:16S rRNA (cytosine1407-C5)-methyltransferase